MSWTIQDAERDRETIEEIERQEDRGAAIISGAFFENRLTNAILAKMLKDEKVTNAFFKGMGPLATFSAKIDMAYLMSVIDSTTREKCHTIRKIRNEFAHNTAAITFESQKISGLCTNLTRTADFTKLANLMKTELSDDPDLLHFIDLFIIPLGKLADTSRNSYLSTIKIILVFLSVPVSDPSEGGRKVHKFRTYQPSSV